MFSLCAHSSDRLLHNAVLFFFFNDTATTEIYTLSLHDALPILGLIEGRADASFDLGLTRLRAQLREGKVDTIGDRKSTRLNSSHRCISYAVFCLKKKKNVESAIT